MILLNSYTVSDDEFDNFILYASQTIKEMDSHEIADIANHYQNLAQSLCRPF